MAEVIKHAAIADERLFGFIETHLDAILALDGEKLKHILQRNCQIKADIVSLDPHEGGLRAVLNAGHTIGHALEAAADWRMSHGEGVALGLVAETRLAVELGRCEEVHAARIEALVNRAGLGVTRDEVDPIAARQALRRDKKIRDGVLKLPLITAIGHVELFDDVSPTVAESVLDGVLRPVR
jgi:3-dehydroquinate synthase